MFYGCTGGQTRLGVDYTKRTGLAVARQLKKHGQVRFQTIAMRRSAGCLCKWHTLLMALGNADTGKKLLHGAVTTSGGRPTSNLTKDGPPKAARNGSVLSLDVQRTGSDRRKSRLASLGRSGAP